MDSMATRTKKPFRAALLRCREFKIPASERSLRDALLPWAAMLETDERFKDYVREIHLEWERRQESDRAEETGRGAATARWTT